MPTKKIMMSKSINYLSAGVNIEAGNEFACRIGQLAKSTQRPEVLAGIGGFAGIMAIPSGYQEPLLVSGTDGVGTKLRIAFATGIHHTVGIDLVAMGVNDVLTVGAEPLFFLDYFATGKLEPQTAEEVIKGIIEGCRQAKCTLLGGETAEMPDMYPPGEYDLAGFAVGVVERSKLVDGSRIKAGDQVIGLPSSGLHSNGFSLARKVLIDHPRDLEKQVPELGHSLAEELLKPTIIYAEAVQLAMQELDVKAIVHITGGGLIDNPPRCIDKELAYRLHTKAWDVPPIMQIIAKKGKVPLDEMRRTFNMGLGMLIVVPAAQAFAAVKVLVPFKARLVGEICSRVSASVEFID